MPAAYQRQLFLHLHRTLDPVQKKAPFVAANGAGGFSLGVTYGFQSVKVRWALVIQSGPMPLNSFSVFVLVKQLSVDELAGSGLF